MVGTWILLWIPLVVVAILNGILRESVFAKWMAELPAHQLSTLTGCVAVGIYVWLVMKRWPIDSSGQALLIGGIWLFMTVAFEFTFGRFVIGHSWERLFQDYNLLAGRLWLLFLIWVALVPWVIFQLRTRLVSQ